MREITANDLVHRIVGRSFVQGPVESRDDGPPSPGDWADQAPYYRVPLRDYAPFPEPISLAAFIPLYESELRQDLAAHPSFYPFIFYDDEREVRLRQGGYINECTTNLFEAVRQAIGEAPPPSGAPTPPAGARPASADREFLATAFVDRLKSPLVDRLRDEVANVWVHPTRLIDSPGRSRCLDLAL